MFAWCTASELQTLARNTDEVSVPAGRTLIVQGETNHTFFLLAQGEADVVVNGESVDRLRSGDFFGEISMLDRGHATASVVALSPLELLVMSHAQFRDAVQSNDEIAFKVMAVMAQRLRSHNRSGV
jgi:CRP-like cAMP-binding protein